MRIQMDLRMTMRVRVGFTAAGASLEHIQRLEGASNRLAISPEPSGGLPRAVWQPPRTIGNLPRTV